MTTRSFQWQKGAHLPYWRSGHLWSHGLPKISEPQTINTRVMKWRQYCLDDSNKNTPTWPWPLWLTWLECRPINRRVSGLISAESTCLSCRFGPQLGCVQEATNRCFSLSHWCFSPSLYLPLSMPSGEDKKQTNTPTTHLPIKDFNINMNSSSP